MAEEFTKLLLCNDPDAPTTVVDTTPAKFGSAHLVLDGKGDYVNVPGGVGFILGGDFEITFDIRAQRKGEAR